MDVGVYDMIDDQFKILKPLGTGYTADVLLAEHIESNTPVAIKIYKPTGNAKIQEKSFANEVNTMRSISNDNVVKILAGNNAGIYKQGKSEKTIMYMGVELCKGGEFFDYIADPGKGFDENTARFYFKQLMNGLKGIHDAGLAHRDLKTENLFVDDGMNVKIGDFGFAKFVDAGNDKGLLKTALGTPGYQCPELLEGDAYLGSGNDIFACGVILFIMYCGFPPFREAKKYDPWYRHFFNKNPNMFWSMHTKQKRTPVITDSFKELINGMLAAKDRFSLADVINSAWVNEKDIDVDALNSDMTERRAIVNKNKKKQDDAMDVDDNDGGNDKVYRGADEDKEALENFLSKFNEITFEDFEVKNWTPSTDENNYVKFKLTPKTLLTDVCSKLILKYSGVKINISDNSYKAKVEFVPTELVEVDENAEIDIDELPYELDLELEVFGTDDGSVLKFSKSDWMTQYNFKNFLSSFRSQYGLSA